MNNPSWFKKRRYRHIDLPVSQSFIKKTQDPNYVAVHSFSPLIHYVKKERKYKLDATSGIRTVKVKNRPIKYACHKDACIYSYYSYQLNLLLEKFYEENNISECVAAYRSLGMSNYDFAAKALNFAETHKPVSILAFDVSGFFDNLDHNLIKQEIKSITQQKTLSKDWFNVFKSITNFRYFSTEDIKKSSNLKDRLSRDAHGRIATIRELKSENILFRKNPEVEKGNNRGIPQGTPISATISNLYMHKFDLKMKTACDKIGALYIRYSDDILVICDINNKNLIKRYVEILMHKFRLSIEKNKTEIVDYDGKNKNRYAQYLGFKFTESGPIIREATLSRQWRILKKKIKWAKINAKRHNSKKIYKRKLYKRFSYIKTSTMNGMTVTRNFSSYARRCHLALGDNSKIINQIKNFERRALKEIRRL